ncbi:MAG: DUF1501 domain-containing protein [Planctomycetota bacterium]
MRLRMRPHWPSSELAAGLGDRRRFCKLGTLGFFGLNLSGIRAATSGTGRGPSGGKVKSCIFIFYYGGPSHIDTWDMKPEAPAEIRGEFKPISTSVPGINICEHMPRAARVMDKLCILRGMHHKMSNHNSAAVEALCGRAPLRGDLELLADDELSFPCHGAALGYSWRNRGTVLPFVALPHVMYNVVRLPGQSAGMLGSAYNALQIEGDPNSPQFQVSNLNLRDGINESRLRERQSLLQLVEEAQRERHASKSEKALDAYYEKTFELLRSEAVRQALDISREDLKTRERYGRNVHGQSVLLARRLVEAEVPFISVHDKVHNGQEANWDSHAQVFPRHRDHLLPPADQALAALIDDLDARGLLDTTLVVAQGEFGRTPKINGGAGRDHWPNCFSVVLAGGGIAGGVAYGSSDRIGAYPDQLPVTPGDLAATIFWGLGLDPAIEIHDATGRPFRLAEGTPLYSLFQS